MERAPSPVGKVTGDAKLGQAAPGGVVFSDTPTLNEPLFATRRSGRPSPLTSAAATASGPMPAGNATAAAKLGATAPVAVVFSNTDTSLELELATRRSGRPSPLMSPVATDQGPRTTAKLTADRKLGLVAP